MSSHKSAYYFDSLHYLAELQLASAKKWLLSLKKAAEQTNNPELFEFHHQAATIIFSMIKAHELLSIEYDKKLEKAKEFNLQHWAELDTLRTESQDIRSKIFWTEEYVETLKEILVDTNQSVFYLMECLSKNTKQINELSTFLKQHNLWETYLKTYQTK